MSANKPKDLFLLEGISYLVFNKDFTQCALSKKDYDIYIYQVPNIMDTNTWKLLYTLKNHFQYISGLDWNPVTNKILSCSYDKTSFVWKFEGDKWGFENVVANTKVSFLFCSWNKRGDKFLEGTGNKSLFVGYFSSDPNTNWWTGRPIKVHKKTSIICAKFDPSSLYVISGATDLKVHVTSCYMKGVDDDHISPEQAKSLPEFGESLYSFDAGAWVISCGWTLDGKYGIASSQKGQIAIIDWQEKKEEIINCNHSPVTFIVPVSATSFYAVGFDREIYLYEQKEGKWALAKVITKKEKKEDSKSSGPINTGATGGGVAEALKKFSSQGMKKKQSLVVTTEKNENGHSSCISSITIKGDDIITTDLSGFVKYWKK